MDLPSGSIAAFAIIWIIGWCLNRFRPRSLPDDPIISVPVWTAPLIGFSGTKEGQKYLVDRLAYWWQLFSVFCAALLLATLLLGFQLTAELLAGQVIFACIAMVSLGMWLEYPRKRGSSD